MTDWTKALDQQEYLNKMYQMYRDSVTQGAESDTGSGVVIGIIVFILVIVLIVGIVGGCTDGFTNMNGKKDEKKDRLYTGMPCSKMGLPQDKYCASNSCKWDLKRAGYFCT